MVQFCLQEMSHVLQEGLSQEFPNSIAGNLVTGLNVKPVSMVSWGKELTNNQGNLHSFLLDSSEWL